uniref:Uncharacterized protein n=1 Tax=Gossypium raimondii TaxID=29730 RepID=A0A0D2N5R3_GOSRA|nr:hypothetical protein B456_005G165300 [Gossypium raimondii]
MMDRGMQDKFRVIVSLIIGLLTFSICCSVRSFLDLIYLFVAESTGHQMSSRLLSMKSANSLKLCLVIIRKETFLLNKEKV